jgi:hypothetical protein
METDRVTAEEHAAGSACRGSWSSRWLLPVAALVTLAVYLAVPVLWATAMARKVDERQRRIVYHSDHPAILAAAQQLLRTAKTADPVFYDRSDARLPTVIRKLRPSDVAVDTSRVSIEMGGGWEHYGLDVYAAGVRPESDFELIPGLWYHSDTHRLPSRR